LTEHRTAKEHIQRPACLKFIHLYYFICLVLAISTAVTLGLSIFSLLWEGSSFDLSRVKANLPPGLQLTEYMGGRLVLVHGLTTNQTSKVSPWPNNPDLLTNTHSGLWSTCLAFNDKDFFELNLELPWIGKKCYSHENRIFPAKDKFHIPRWRRVMNLSISCCLTSLIIICAAVLLGIIGVLYKQAACILVTSVLFQLAIFFSVFGMAIHFTNRVERRQDLSSSCGSPTLCESLTYWTGWSQYLGLGGVSLCIVTAGAVYGLSRVVITLCNTVPDFKKRIPV